LRFSIPSRASVGLHKIGQFGTLPTTAVLFEPSLNRLAGKTGRRRSSTGRRLTQARIQRDGQGQMKIFYGSCSHGTLLIAKYAMNYGIYQPPDRFRVHLQLD